MKQVDLEALDWEKSEGLLPAVIQDCFTGAVLMLAYMNREALDRTLESGKVTFFSRSRQELWTKGETSGNYLMFKEIEVDCDADALLIQAEPCGPTCHRGTVTCFQDEVRYRGLTFLNHLESLILDRKQEMPRGSYTTELFTEGLPEISKKVGEEAVEVIVSALQGRERTVEESADLIYHLLVLLAERGISFAEVVEELRKRHGENR